MPIVSIEGLIGVGKSTLISDLAATNEGFVASTEFVNPKLLSIMYDNPKEAMLWMQIMMLYERQNPTEAPPEATTIIQDRSPYGNLVFSRLCIKLNLINDVGVRYITELTRCKRDRIISDNPMVYLYCEPHRATERCQNRARNGESTAVDIAYQQQLEVAHVELILDMHNVTSHFSHLIEFPLRQTPRIAVIDWTEFKSSSTCSDVIRSVTNNTYEYPIIQRGAKSDDHFSIEQLLDPSNTETRKAFFMQMTTPGAVISVY